MAKILIIEDNQDNLALARLILETEKHEVFGAEEAPIGIQIAKKEKPDLILMDLQLPKMDGLTAARLVKEDPEMGHIKIVALTALAMKGDKEKILSQGMDGYISKPFFRKEFLSKVRSFLP
ncbi:MAG: response regulator [Fibrobacterales bacterium]